MKLVLTALLATTVISSSAIGGSLETPAVEAAAIAAAETVKSDWGGAYVGGSYAFEAGDWETYDEGEFGNVWITEGEKYGAFAGYNIQRDALVFGAEVAYSSGESVATYNGLFQDLAETTIDAKARVGYALGDVLLYGVAGGSVATAAANGTTVDLTGLNYGAGAQMKFDNGMFVGAEYLIRNLGGANPEDADITFEYNTQSVALRAGWQF